MFAINNIISNEISLALKLLKAEKSTRDEKIRPKMFIRLSRLLIQVFKKSWNYAKEAYLSFFWKQIAKIICRIPPEKLLTFQKNSIDVQLLFAFKSTLNKTVNYEFRTSARVYLLSPSLFMETVNWPDNTFAKDVVKIVSWRIHRLIFTGNVDY